MNTNEVARWLALANLSQEERKVKQPNWDKYKEYFKGIQWDSMKDNGSDVITVNMVYAQVSITVPSIYARNPKVYLVPRRPSAENKSKIGEAVINQDLDVMDFKQEMKMAIVDAIIYGTGFLKTTYFVEEEEESPVEEPDNEMESLLATFRGQPPNLTALTVGKNGPRVIRVSPYDIAYTPGITSLNEAGFIAHRVRKRLSVVKADKYYTNTKDLQPVVRLNEEIRSAHGAWSDDIESATAMVDLWEFWDIDNHKLFVLAEGHDEALVEPYEHPYPYDHPFDKLIFTYVPDEVLGMSQVEPGIPQQDELNRMRTLHMSHVKRFGRKYVTKVGSIQSEEQKARLEEGEDGVVIEVTDENASTAITPLQDAQLPQDFYLYTGTIKDDLTEILGITPYKKGLLRGANSATEASIAETHSNARDEERVDIVSDVVEKIVKKIILCRKEFTPTEEIIQITEDIVSGPTWEVWSKETFDIEADVDIEYGSSLPSNQEANIQKYTALYTMLSTNMTVHPQAAAVKLLEAYGVRDTKGWFLPPEIIAQQIINQQVFGNAGQKGLSPNPTGGTPPPEPGAGNPGDEQARQLGAAKGGTNGKGPSLQVRSANAGAGIGTRR